MQADVLKKITNEQRDGDKNKQAGVEGSTKGEMKEDEAFGGDGNVKENDMRSNDNVSYKSSSNGSEASHGRRGKTTLKKFDFDSNKPYFKTKMTFLKKEWF